jgi:hypothetical protein
MTERRWGVWAVKSTHTVDKTAHTPVRPPLVAAVPGAPEGPALRAERHPEGAT